MIKISALNEESEEESGSDEEVTKEALEQIALQQYAKALDLQRKGNLKDATQLIKDLLDTEVLYDVKKPTEGEKISGPLFNLKYLCYKNLAAMLCAADDSDGAIEAFCAAAELDDTDVTLWYKMGLLCISAKRYEMALHAFQRGVDCNPNHWPCLDKIVTLLLGLDYKEECISTIHDTLQLDPGYLRGLAYRKHIYTEYPYIKDFMEYLNPMYKWNQNDDEDIDSEKALKLIKEAEEIHETFLVQQKAEQFKYVLPNLKLKKPIRKLTWSSVGDSLIHMHQYMTDNCFSHACYLQLIFEKEQLQIPMEIPEEIEALHSDNQKSNDNEKVDVSEKVSENVSENENNDMSDKDKAATDTEKVESDVEMLPTDQAMEMQTDNLTETPPEPKAQKKPPVRRRGSALSFLQQWEWCNKRRSGRKKTVNKQEQDENIYETLRRMVPVYLTPDIIEKRENQARQTSPDPIELDKLFEEKEKKDTDNPGTADEYFNTDNEQQDVKDFINKYSENKRDIIDMLKEYLSILAGKWRIKWPDGLSKMFVEANKCYNNHIDVPACTGDNQEELLHFITVNILVEEFLVNDKLNSNKDNASYHDLSTIETIGIAINLKPNLFTGTDCLELVLRHLWVKYHIHLLNKCENFGLDCLYQLSYEFEAMEEHHETYTINIVNFTFKPIINESEILASIKFLERNKKLSTVMDLFDRGKYEEVLSIAMDSFEHCKNIARNQEEEMSLDFAVQLSLILDTLWALNKVDDCIKWSLICLHEALKHYFRFTTGSTDYDKWNLTVVKILYCMDHILSSEGLSCLESLSQKELSQGLEDLIRIIGHQVETTATEMPFGTIIPWIIMHYILQREEDQGRGRIIKDKIQCDEVPNPLMVLFIAHEQLGSRGWCCNSEGKLLFFVLDTVVPRLRSPALAKSLEQVIQYMEQCVFCLFGHPGKKTKLKYLVDHNVTPHQLDWRRAQQVYEIFRPPILPALEGKVSRITADTEQLFHRILMYLPSECDPQKYIPLLEKYIKGIEDNLPNVPPLFPYKMKDIYYLLGDYYFKKDERKMAVKFNMLDVIVNSDRLESWAEISLAKTVNLERVLNSCKNLNNEREFLSPAKAIIRCFKRALHLDPTHCNLWIEYGIFVYTVHSFCSRLLKQASESLSMEDFESLEKQKEDMLDTTHKCFTTVLEDLNNSADSDKANEDSWLPFYMLGKVAEKRNKPPSVYLEYYMEGVKSLQETDATYPQKINYNSPTNLCIEVLELHYRMHTSILKYIEQHENKPIPGSVGKVFLNCITEWKKGPFSRKPKKDNGTEIETESTPVDQIQAANILKRSVSDAGEEETHEAKRLKLEAAAAKIRRSASYDTERIVQKETSVITSTDKITELSKSVESVTNNAAEQTQTPALEEKPTSDVEKTAEEKVDNTKTATEQKKGNEGEKKEESSSTSSSSTSDSSSSDSTTDSSTDSSRDTDTSSKSSNESTPLTEDEIMKIVCACLDALEDCASRFPPHYKAIYRLAHYHFYYKKGKDIERCRDLMLSNFISRSGQKLGGLFSERKHSNFFNNIWKIPSDEVDRAGGFAFHMSRTVQLTMEILKEIDDHKTLLDLSLHLQRIPEPDKKYLRDSDREELAQQAFSLCVQSLKGQLTKFSQQADLKSNKVEKQALKSLTLDIYRAYQRAQKQPNSKQFTNLLVEAYKLVCTTPITDNMNLVDLSMKYCQSLIQALKQQATQASIDKSQNAQKKQLSKSIPSETPKATTTSVSNSTSKTDHKTTTTTSSGLPKMSAHEIASAFQNYMPMLNDPVLSQQAAAALSLSYLSNISALAGYTSLQNTLQSSLQTSLQNSFQAEFYRQFLGQSFSSFGMPPQKKQKRAPKATNSMRSMPQATTQMKPSKSFAGSSMTSVTKAAPTSVITSIQKANSTPSMSSIHKSNLSTSTSSNQKINSSTVISSNQKTTSSTGMSSNPKINSSTVMSSSQKTNSSTGVNSNQKTNSSTGVISNQKINSSTGMGSNQKNNPVPLPSSLIQKASSTQITPSMGTVLPTLPASMTANLTAFGAPTHVPSLSHTNLHTSLPTQAHMSNTSITSNTIHTKPPKPHQQVSPGKTLQEKLAERQKHLPVSKPTSSHDINASISKLPSSLTITKTSVPKQPVPPKKTEAKKSLLFNEVRPKQISTDEVIVLDDDD